MLPAAGSASVSPSSPDPESATNPRRSATTERASAFNYLLNISNVSVLNALVVGGKTVSCMHLEIDTAQLINGVSGSLQPGS